MSDNKKLDLSKFGLSLTTIFLVIWCVGVIFLNKQLFEWWWFLVLFIAEFIFGFFMLAIIGAALK